MKNWSDLTCITPILICFEYQCLVPNCIIALISKNPSKGHRDGLPESKDQSLGGKLH